VTVEENGAEVNFELVERLAQREERDWAYFGRLRHEREKKLRDPEDVLIEADRLRQQLKKRRAQRRRRGTLPQRFWLESIGVRAHVFCVAVVTWIGPVQRDCKQKSLAIR
jgi:hypothetical protein